MRRTWRRSICTAIASPARSDVCRCGCSACRRRMASCSRITSAARSSSPTSCATSTRTQRLGRLYLPREALLHAGITSNDPNRVIAERALSKVCVSLTERAKAHFEKSDEIMKRNRRRVVRAPRIMSKYYHSHPGPADRARLQCAARAGASCRAGHTHFDPAALRFHLMQNTAHIIGAGISGLSAAVRLANAGYKVAVHEATHQAGGRCRSYFDGATNLTIDNGNHLAAVGQQPCAWPMRARSAPKPASSGLRARSFPSSISRPGNAGSSISVRRPAAHLGVRRGPPRA